MGQEPVKTRAIVAHGPLSEEGWKMEELTLRDLRDDEMVVEIVASGICHTDVSFGGNRAMPNSPFHYPRVLGHEGSGYVRRVGPKVTVAQEGDPVLLSFDSCGSCHVCKDEHPSYCAEFDARNLIGGNGEFYYKAPLSGKPDIAGRMFGQSSFANFTIVPERSVANMRGFIDDRKELELFAPLGCGIQTGSGTVINTAGGTSKDVVAVIGLGGVGLSAILGAGVIGCKTIIGIDLLQSRLDFAQSMGATHVFNARELNEEQMFEAVRKATDGVGPSITIDTTGVPSVILQGIKFTRQRGKILQVGAANPPGASVNIDITYWLSSGKSYQSAVEGDSVPSKYSKEMIKWYREGRFPIDRLVKYYKADEYLKAIHDMHSGETVKPILLWS